MESGQLKKKFRLILPTLKRFCFMFVRFFSLLRMYTIDIVIVLAHFNIFASRDLYSNRRCRKISRFRNTDESVWIV